MNAQNYFNIKTEEQSIGVKRDSIVDEDAAELELEMADIVNPNLNNYIKRLESKGKPQTIEQKPKEESRVRKFKKPLNLLAVRKERLEMVKGLNGKDSGYDQNSKNEKKKASKLPGEEEATESTMTHDEIRQWHDQYHISWQQIFSLDAEFWSLITIEQEEKEKDKKKKSGKTNDLFDFGAA